MSHEVFLTERWQNKHRVWITLDGVGSDLMPPKPRLDENRRRRFLPISHWEKGRAFPGCGTGAREYFEHHPSSNHFYSKQVNS